MQPLRCADLFFFLLKLNIERRVVSSPFTTRGSLFNPRIPSLFHFLFFYHWRSCAPICLFFFCFSACVCVAFICCVFERLPIPVFHSGARFFFFFKRVYHSVKRLFSLSLLQPTLTCLENPFFFFVCVVSFFPLVFVPLLYFPSIYAVDSFFFFFLQHLVGAAVNYFDLSSITSIVQLCFCRAQSRLRFVFVIV